VVYEPKKPIDLKRKGKFREGSKRNAEGKNKTRAARVGGFRHIAKERATVYHPGEKAAAEKRAEVLLLDARGKGGGKKGSRRLSGGSGSTPSIWIPRLKERIAANEKTAVSGKGKTDIFVSEPGVMPMFRTRTITRKPAPAGAKSSGRTREKKSSTIRSQKKR